MAKFTPGKWEYAILPNNRHEIVSPLPHRVIIATVWGDEKTAAADAHLIAAAPELYEALKDLTEAVRYLQATVADYYKDQGLREAHHLMTRRAEDKAKSALAKADGEAGQ